MYSEVFCSSKESRVAAGVYLVLAAMLADAAVFRSTTCKNLCNAMGDGIESMGKKDRGVAAFRNVQLTSTKSVCDCPIRAKTLCHRMIM